jgi:tetratricopeptide (TPR) repeat protein
MEKTLKAFEASLNEVIEKVENFKERLDLEKIDNSIISMGISLYKLKLYEDSLPCFHLGLDIKKKLSSKDTLETGLKPHWTGASYQKLAKYDEAIRHYNEALLIYMRVMPNYAHYKSDVLNDIAECLYHQKKYDEALKVFNESNEFRKRALDYNENGKGKCLYNIGLIYKDQEKYVDALDYFNRSLEIYERIKFSLGDKIPEDGNFYEYN